MRSFPLTLVACIAVLSCNPDRSRPELYFVHATAPELFEVAALDSTTATAADTATARHQQSRNRTALQRMFLRIKSMNYATRPRFLVITGDFGIRPFLAATSPGPGAPSPAGPGPGAATAPPAAADPGAASPSTTPGPDPRLAQDSLAVWLASSPVPDVYVVPGDADAGQRADGDSLARVGAFFDGVNARLAASGVTIRDLTRCYQGGDAPLELCEGDVAGTSLRLIGVPTHSFANSTDALFESNDAVQLAQLGRLDTLVNRAATASKRAVLVGHIAEIDDPVALSDSLFRGADLIRRDTLTRTRSSSWRLSSEAFERWEGIIGSTAVVGFLGGHLTDSHREAYEPPYRLTLALAARPGAEKNLIAPPLSVGGQAGSPLQARGFSYIALSGSNLDPTLLWYSAETGTFAADEASRPASAERPGLVGRSLAAPREALVWMWNLSPAGTDLLKMVLIFIALLAAFLALVDLNISPISSASSPPTTPPPGAGGGGAGGEGESGGGSAGILPFRSNVARAAGSGIAGLFSVAALKGFFDSGGIQMNEEAFYIVWFVAAFFTFSIFFALYGAVIDSLQSRLAIPRFIIPQPPRPQGGTIGRRQIQYWFERWLRWVASYRSTVLVFLESILDSLFGRSGSPSRLHRAEIVKLHSSLLRSVDEVRGQLDDAVEAALGPPQTRGPKRFRLNFSILSRDESEAYYISWQPGSSTMTFPRTSVAWFSVFTGEARWWKEGFEDKGLTLYKNELGDVPDVQGKLMFDQYFQARRGSDYEAFVVLPVPWRRRRSGAPSRRAGIHISFRSKADFEALWNLPDVDQVKAASGGSADDYFNGWEKLLDAAPALVTPVQPPPAPNPADPLEVHIRNEGLGAAIRWAEAVLPTLLRRFNHSLFETGQASL